MPEYRPVDGVTYDGTPAPLSKLGTAVITGGRLVEQTTAGGCAHAAAASAKVLGVARSDFSAAELAAGMRVQVWPITNAVHEVEVVGTTMVPGDGVQAAANGMIQAVAIATAAANGSLIGICDVGAAAGSKARFTGRH
jgi:hypothetical protein